MLRLSALSLINTKQDHLDASVILFAAVGASKAKYHTDAHYDNIDTNGFNVIAGIGKDVKLFDKRGG
ncbi:MAG: hypothetical protein LBJ79_03425 [Endomicrobium sp.]|jgi:hypothetical protein|nr:hypothetical protein [Endomicrobium sp.]